jgi:hypothetical protein
MHKINIGSRFLLTKATLLIASLTLGSVVVGSVLSKGGSGSAAADLASAREREKALVGATIVDADRNETFLQLIAERDQLLDQQIVVTREHIERIQALTSNYRSTRAEFSELFAGYNKFRIANQRRYVETIAAMKQATTRDEWKAISNFQLKYLEARAAIYRPAVEVE